MVLKKRKSISVLFAAIVASALLLLVGAVLLLPTTTAYATATGNAAEVTAGGTTTSYATFADAWAAAIDKDTATVKMLENAETANKLSVASGKNITLDLNGHKLSLTYIYSIEINGKLTLTDSDPTSAGNSVTSPVTNAEVPITGGVLTSEKSHAVYVSGEGEFVMETGNISGCKGSGVYLYGDNSKFTMKKGVISHNLATGCGGGVQIEKGTFDMSGGSIINNRVIANSGNPFGGGVYLMSNANMNVSGNAIISDNTHGDGNITDNVTLNSNTIKVNGNLTSGARIGITKKSYDKVVTVVTNYTQSDEPSKYFFSDSGSYAIKRGEGNTVVLGEPDPVAEVTATGNNGTAWTEKYISFATAWEMATDSAPATVKLLADAETSASLTVAADKNITLDLNGHKLARVDDGDNVIEVAGTLTLADTGDNNVAHRYNVGSDGKWTFADDGEHTLYGGVITGGYSGVYIDGGTFHMNGGAIAGNKANIGSGVNIYAGTFDMTGGTISGNTTRGNGGGVHATDGAFTMSGGSITDNVAYSGGGVYMSGGTFNMTGGVISKNSADDYGGGVCASDSTFTMSGGKISANSATKEQSARGGGVYIERGTFNMQGGVIGGDTAADANRSKYGGGVRVNARATFVMTDGAIKNNKADHDGGGLCVYAATKVELGGGEISQNTAESGGGIYFEGITKGEDGVDPAEDYVLNGTTVTNNTQTAYGGGIYIDGSTVTMRGGKISGNTSYTSGGGVYIANTTNSSDDVISAAVFTMTGGTIGGANDTDKNGTGDGGGGGVYINSGTFNMADGAVIRGNTADYFGSGVYLHGGAFNMSGGAISDNKATGVGSSGGGVRVFDGAFNMTGGTISGNTADYGGGVRVYGGAFTMSGGTISGNTAAFGGGVSVSGGTFAMSGGNISANSVKERVTPCGGGGVYIDGGAFAMSGGVIGGDTAADANNSRNGDGGGVYLKSGAFDMSGGAEIRGNKAVSSGSGVYVSGGTFAMSSGVISDNNTTSNGSSGGGVRVYGGAFNMTGGTISGNTAAFGGGVCIVVGTFAMSGGSITNNVANYGGGVYFMGGAFEISGAVTVTGNKMNVTGIDIANNVYLSSGKVMTVTGALTAGANIGVTLAGGYSGAFTSGYGSYNKNGDKTIAPSAYFVSDDNTLCAQTTDTSPDEASLAAHSYSATYVWADDNSSCTASLLCSICGHASKTETASGSAITSVSSAATCTQGGYVGFKATFTDSAFEAQIKKIQETPAIGHTLSSVALQPATCTQDGVLAHELCSVCGSIFVENEEKTEEELKISALGHDIVSQAAKAPTCTEVGWNAHEACSRCDYSTKVEIAALGHDVISHEAKPATCTEKGWNAYETCSRCDHSTKVEIAAIGHAWGAWTTTKAPTCTEEGSKQRVCDHDGEHKETQAIAAIGHAWGEWTTTKAPTCTEEGSKQRVCDHDGEHKETQAIAAIGHVEVTDAAVLPTCTEKGLTEGKHCSRCEAVLTAQEEVAALGHAWGEWTEVKASTLNEFGEETRVCAHDGEHKQTRQIPKRVPQLVKPDASGEVNQVEVTLPDGFKADVELVVTEIAEENYGEYEGIARAANGEIGFVYDVTLKSGGVAIQPDGTLTIKLLIPTELRGKSFKLFHLHGGEAVQTEYTVDGNYAVVTADKLSEFVFVGEKSSAAVEESNAAWIALIVLLCVIIVAEVAYVTLRKTGKIRFGGEK